MTAEKPASSWREAPLPEPPNVLHVTARRKLIDYAKAAEVAMRSGAFNTIKLVGCGSDIERAVALAELLRRGYMAGEVEVRDIRIGTLVKGEARTSFIEIELAHKTGQGKSTSNK